MILERFPELDRLSDSDKKQLVLEILDEMLDHGEPDPVIVEILENRQRQFEQNPGSARRWEEVRDRILVSRRAGKSNG